MVRPRGLSASSEVSSVPDQDQELGSMYDYLAKVILLGPSGAGKSCVLHRFVKNECTHAVPQGPPHEDPSLTPSSRRFTGRILSSQTIGVEFASRIVKLGSGSRRRRIKLQLWDTAGTERFRSVSRSYYRGAAGAILVYDVSSYASFAALPTFLMDARALASPNLTVLLAGNKADLADATATSDPDDMARPPPTPSRGEVSPEDTSRWAAQSNIPVAVEVSALTGEGVDEIFQRLARIILTKIELGEIDPDDPQSGIQYGDGGMYGHGTSDASSIRSRATLDDNSLPLHRTSRRRGRGPSQSQGWRGGMREWEDVFRLGSSSRRNQGCC
ncbi:Ras-related protein RABA1b [Penicillium argentinense]|uniref:Ras-related protein RABA1b n=1 Tax=Penicillium argentinense TaxID=1131581 RepID=A0A9W9KKL9_9EURO|nr:Ras-related protein RABA1b [Penicillium argentinense]KAJ5109785.1 Ras-related protein RABA1b [Penicillium argentinense]